MKYGQWICADEIPQSARLYYFQKKFVAADGASMTASISADSRYRLYVNGKFVCDGPCRGSQYQHFYETVDITPYIAEGENVIEARVLYLTEGMFISVFREYHPALWFDGDLLNNGSTERITTDDTWTCKRLDNHIFKNGEGVHPSMPCVEFIDGEDVFTDVPVRWLSEANAQHSSYNEWGCRDKYALAERSIPLMRSSAPKHFNIVNKGDGFIDIDTGVYTTANVNIAFKGKKGSKLTIFYNECYVQADGSKNMRDDTKADLVEKYADTIILTGEKRLFTSFFFRAFRYIRLEFTDSEIEFDWDNTTYEDYFYPMEQTGTFECSDERLNKMWDVSINTIKCCMHEIYVDCPHYEQQQYGMDSAIETQCTYRITSDVRMQRKCITDIAHSQLPDGMLQANFPSVGVQVIPTFSMFWVFMLREYLRHTGDTSFVKRFMGTMDKIFEGFDQVLTEEGLFGRTPYWHFTDWVPGWYIGIPNGGQDDQVTVASLIYATALNDAAEICTALGRNLRAQEYKARAVEMNNAVNKYCYDSDAGMYYDTVKCKEFSEHTALWAVLSGAVEGKAAKELIDRIMSIDIPRCSFSMNYYMFRALEKAEKYDYAPRLMAGWQKMLDLHCTTWCENPDSPRSECHGWSSAPIYEFTEMMLGVYPEKDGFKSIRIKPTFNGAEWARGTVPTPYGTVAVSWEKTDGKTVLDVKLPENGDISATIIVPGKEPVVTSDKNIRLCF